jgi:hypothetical protein
MEPNTLNVFFLSSLLLIALLSKDKVVSGVSLLFASTQFFNFFYSPVNWIDLCFESAVCLFMGIAVLSQTVRIWGVSLAIIMISSIFLIFIEFIDYHLFGSYLEQTYAVWINATTALEIIILLMASNGRLHSYAGGNDNFWDDINNFVRDSFGKLSSKEA